MTRPIASRRKWTIGAFVVLLLVFGILTAPSSGALEVQWKLDDGSGTTASDSSSHSRSATLEDDDTGNGDGDTPPSWISSGLPPVPSGTSAALRFDGTDDLVEADSYQGVTGTTPRTVSAWIKTAEKNQHNPIVSWGSGGTSNKWVFKVGKSNALRIENRGGAVIGSTDLTDDLWHHVAVTWKDNGVDDDGESDGTAELWDAKLYVDGAEETISSSLSQGAQEVNTAQSQNVQVGAEGFNSRHFGGDVDEVRIYNEKLTGSQVQALFIPEPASLALLAPAGLLLARRRKRAPDAR